MSRWDELTMAQKSELIGIAVRHGVTGLKEIRNYYEMGGPKRQPMPKHPSRANREKDPEAYSAYEKWQQERNEERERSTEEYRRKVEEQARRNEEAAIELNRRKDVVMSALSDIASSTPFTGNEIIEAADQQRQEKIDKFHELKNGLDATMTAAELVAAGYGITRGLTHLNRQLARQATQSTGQAVSRDALQNLLKWNNRVEAIDKPQVTMNTIGGIADAYQWIEADNSFDAWENGLETGANAAGVIGGTNWFRDLPIYTKFGNTIDNVLDGLGYGAAAWDVIKYLPPLSGALQNIRQQSTNNENKDGGNLSRSRRFDDGGIIDGGILPEVTIEGYSPIVLDTYYPVTSKEFPFTGHSSLKIPVNRRVVWGEDSENAVDEIHVDKRMNSRGYNLVTNNCADETLGYLNSMFNTKESPMLFTTPGDVQDYAIDKLKGRKVKVSSGHDRVYIPRNKSNYRDIDSKAYNHYLNQEDSSIPGQSAYLEAGEIIPSYTEEQAQKLFSNAISTGLIGISQQEDLFKALKRK